MTYIIYWRRLLTQIPTITKDQPGYGYSISNRAILHNDGQKSAKFNQSVKSNLMCAAQRQFALPIPYRCITVYALDKV